MHHFAASSQDQQQAHQIPVPIALEVETPKTDEVLQLVVYLHSETKGWTWISCGKNEKQIWIFVIRFGTSKKIN